MWISSSDSQIVFISEKEFKQLWLAVYIKTANNYNLFVIICSFSVKIHHGKFLPSKYLPLINYLPMVNNSPDYLPLVKKYLPEW